MTEKELIKQCREEKGKRLLYATYVKRMSRLCYRYLPDEADTYDALSTGFMKVFQSLSNFRHYTEGSLEAWISQIMVNECLMLLRKKKKMQSQVALDVEIGAEDADILKFDAAYLYDAIVSLPDGYRTVFNLYEVEGYSHKEIAAMTGIKESASRSQLAHAKRRLREVLKKYLND
ncbi:MAG: sigma-70 family RNA polymerase sigma factor [Bacteroidota bacterium]